MKGKEEERRGEERGNYEKMEEDKRFSRSTVRRRKRGMERKRK